MQNLLLIGGDRRMLCLAELLERDGYTVETLGLRENDQKNVHMEKAEAALLAYPFSVRDGMIPVLTGEMLKAEDVIEKIPKGIPILYGRGIGEYAEQDSCRFKRYSDAAGFEQRNAELSAEAAVYESMKQSAVALMDAKVLVAGYGLFGRAIALRMKTLGAAVWVAARRQEQRIEAEKEGMLTVSIVEMTDVLPQMDLILNTIPARVFGEYHLKQINKECCLLELASAPYGFDMDAARNLGLTCNVMPGLPGRYSPASAARALQEAVCKLLGRSDT